MKPHTTLRAMLVCTKDKLEKEEQGELVYRIPCKNCDDVYVGENGRLLKTRLEEHKKDVTQEEEEQYTRSARRASERTFNKSAVTDHVKRLNHVVDWEDTRIVDRESNKRKRHVRESIWIKRAGPQAMNRDEGNYDLPSVYVAVIPPEQQC